MTRRWLAELGIVLLALGTLGLLCRATAPYIPEPEREPIHWPDADGGVSQG